MDHELETAMLGALARAEAGDDVSPEWLRAAHPKWWRDVEEFLRMHRRLEAGRPEIASVGPYLVRRRIGEGGMGTVYLAEAARGHPSLRPGTPVAVKVVHAHLMTRPRIVERTLREARLGAAVVHENVVRTIDAGHGPAAGASESQGSTALYVVTEHVPGQSLRGVLDETGRLPEDLCRRVARDVLRALVAIHAAGAVHRDLKPENVLLSREGRIVVTDLGAARILDSGERITRSGEFLGSLAYAAPEQVLRPAARADVRSDLYSLGVMLHELADGRHPCTADDPGERRASDIAGPERALPARTGSPRALRASVSPFFRAFIATLSAHEPDARFPSAAAALEALEGAERSAWWRDAKSRTRTAPRPAARTLIGRDDEVAHLVEAAREAAAGRARFVVVTGEAGSGKSHLAESVAARIVAESPAFARITVHHDPGSAARPAGEPWIDALRAHLDGMTDAAAAELAAACSADVPALAAPFLAALRREPAAPLGADATHRAASAYLRAVADGRPVLLVVEDDHVADAEARRRVAALAEDLAGVRVFVLVTRRPPAPDDDAIPRDDARIEHIDLRRLPAEAVATASMMSACCAARRLTGAWNWSAAPAAPPAGP
jgi:serine/threonine protein kinase